VRAGTRGAWRRSRPGEPWCPSAAGHQGTGRSTGRWRPGLAPAPPRSGSAGIPPTLAGGGSVARSTSPATSIDLPGVALLGGGATGLFWGLPRAGDLGWASAQAIGFIGAGLVLIAAFLAWQRRAREPIMPLRLFASRTFAAANATAFLMSATIF